MQQAFGEYIRQQRSRLQETSAAYSVRQIAKKVGFQASYLSKVERGQVSPPSEEKIKRLAAALDEDADVLLALAGKVSADLREAILKRPKLFAELIRQTKKLPEQAVLRIVREVRDGKW